jgi:hypothetical protein
VIPASLLGAMPIGVIPIGAIILAELDWVSIVANLGIPATILMALGIAFWRILAWVGREIIIPMRDRLLTRLTGFFDRVDDALETLTSHMKQQTDAMNELQRTSEDTNKAWLSMRESLRCKYEYKDPKRGHMP